MTDEKAAELLIRIDERVTAIDEKLDKQNGKVDDHEKRIRLGERIRNFALGAGFLSGTGWAGMEWFK